MATELQKRLAFNMIENMKRNEPLNKKQLLVSTGYSEVSAEAYPQKIIEQKGVQEELKARGFDVESAKDVVKEIMLDPDNEPSDRLRAAGEVFKVTGAYAPEKSVHLEITAVHSDKYTSMLDDIESNMLLQATESAEPSED